jgi:hypothetical protein
VSPSTRNLVLALLRYAAEAWAEGDEARAQTWCERAWAHAGADDFVDTDTEVDR